jgi:hypothetical protein
MANLIVNAKDFSPAANMIYGKPKINSKGGKSITITNSKTRRSLMIHTPMMLTYGVNKRTNDDGSISYDMSIQLPREEFATAETRDLQTMMSEMEEKIINDAFANSRDWFGKKYSSLEVIKEFWTPMLKFPKNKDDGSYDTTRAPTIKVKLPFWDGQAKFDLFDLKTTQIYPNETGQGPDELVQKGCNVCCTLLCGGIWITGSKFGVTWKLSQAAVKTPETFEKGKCYVSVCEKTYDSDEEGEGRSFDMKKMSTVVSEQLQTPIQPMQVEVEKEPVSLQPESLEQETVSLQPECEIEAVPEVSKPAKKSVKKKGEKEV